MNSVRQQLRGHLPDVVSKLKPIGPVADSTPIDVVIGLPARNADRRAALLRDLYDPASPHFCEYLSPLEYTETFDPTEASRESLLAFAKANQLTVVSAAHRKFIRVSAPAAVMSRVFHVTLQEYQHPTEDRLFYAPDREPAVDLDTPISQTTGLDNVLTPRRTPNLFKASSNAPGPPRDAGGSGVGGLYTGSDFRAAYAPGVTLTGRGQVVGILELSGYIDSDTATYAQKNGQPMVPIQNVYLDGYTGGNPNLESAADIELVISMAPGLEQVTIYGVSYTNAGIVDALNEMANPTRGEPLPYQITTSYYFFYDQNVYDALARLAVQGQALFVASGDYGSYNETTGAGAFPPADHPLVTSVGGTALQTSGPGGDWVSETTASFSGGGYSPWGNDAQFAIPWWQAGMDYTASKGSATVRNAPDVAMVAENIAVFFNGNWNGFAGTSAAAPLWAGFMALANEQAAASGVPRVGFANPALWAIGRGSQGATCFHDITTGNNFNPTNPDLYSAVVGYDLCTGWGTPNGEKLIDALVGYSAGLGHADLATFPRIAAVGGFFSADDNYRHAIVATEDGRVIEVFFNPQQGQGQVELASLPGIVGLAGFYSPDDGFRHVIVGTSDGNLTEIFYSPQQGQGQAVLGTFPGIVAVGGFFSADDNYRHAIVGTSDGAVTDVMFNPVAGQRQMIVADTAGIVGLAGFWSADDDYRHALAATAGGRLTEFFFRQG